MLIALVMAVRSVALQAPGGKSIRRVRQFIQTFVSIMMVTMKFVSPFKVSDVLGVECGSLTTKGYFSVKNLRVSRMVWVAMLGVEVLS